MLPPRTTLSAAPNTRRHRGLYMVLLVLTLLLGLASRRCGPWLPTFVASYAGDALWALLVFWLVGLGRPRWSSRRVAAAALSFAVLIELSQLWQPPWLLAVRGTTLGGLVLGHGFLWSDLLCYAAGVATGYVVERVTGCQHVQA